MKHLILYYLFIQCFCFSCEEPNNNPFQGKWQSLNDSHTVIEFTPEQKIILYKDSTSFWSLVTKHGELTCLIKKESTHWYTFDAIDGGDIFFKGRIETVKDGRIRIYLLKHHHILDLADEYSRTNDFHSFTSILNEINPPGSNPNDYWNN